MTKRVHEPAMAWWEDPAPDTLPYNVNLSDIYVPPMPHRVFYRAYAGSEDRAATRPHFPDGGKHAEHGIMPDQAPASPLALLTEEQSRYLKGQQSWPDVQRIQPGWTDQGWKELPKVEDYIARKTGAKFAHVHWTLRREGGDWRGMANYRLDERGRYWLVLHAPARITEANLAAVDVDMHREPPLAHWQMDARRPPGIFFHLCSCTFGGGRGEVGAVEPADRAARRPENQ